MALIEVDENEFHNNKKLVNLVQSMLKNPESRKRVLEAHKIVEPGVSIPEIDARAPVEAAVAAVEKRFTDFVATQEAERKKEREEAQKNDFVAKFESGRNRLRDAGYTDEGIKKVEDLMSSAGIVDHVIGEAAFSKLNPEPEPAPPAPNFGFGGIFSDNSKNPDEFLKSMHASRGNDEAALDKRIYEVLQETRQQNGTPQHRTNNGRR